MGYRGIQLLTRRRLALALALALDVPFAIHVCGLRSCVTECMTVSVLEWGA